MKCRNKFIRCTLISVTKFAQIILILLLQPLGSFIVSALPTPRQLSRSSTTRYNSLINMEWKVIDPTQYKSPFINGRRIARDQEFLVTIRRIWHDRVRRIHEIETLPTEYSGRDQKPLFGHLFRRVHRDRAWDEDAKLPVVLLFHTGAGPQDVFLIYKADSLLQNFDCVVMICDILSDANGWGWESDRARYNSERNHLLAGNAEILKDRVLAALKNLSQHFPFVATDRVAAMGFCLGGQPIMEMSNLYREQSRDEFTVRALITFHGVFARQKPLPIAENEPKSNDDVEHRPIVLIWNGANDPFVASTDLEEASVFFKANGFEVELMQVENAKHGFTNPAQDSNPNPAFGFCEEGSQLAWEKSLTLLRETIF